MRVLPNDIESERGLIGSILIDPDLFAKLTVKASDFYDPINSKLFGHLKDMYADNMSIDNITIRNYIILKGDMPSLNNGKFLNELIEEAIIPNHALFYEEIILDKSKLRNEIETLKVGIDSAYNGVSGADEVISKLSLSHLDNNKDEPIEVLGNKFIDDCIEGKVGSFDWWCPEWTSQLGKMSSELMLLHAPRSTGKTALMLQWILESHKKEQRTPLASIEMLKKELLPRLIATQGQVNTYTMRVRGRTTEDEVNRSRQAVNEIKALELCVRDKGMSIDDIRAWAISEARVGVDAIFIDNLLSINDGGVQFQSKTIMYDFFIRRLRDLRDDLKVPIIILAHPNADNQIAWSRDVENFADTILFLINATGEGIDVNGKTIYQDHSLSGQHIIAKFQKQRQGLSPVASLCFTKETQTFEHVRWE